MSFTEIVLAVGPENLYSNQRQSGRCCTLILNEIVSTVSIVNYVLKHPEMVGYVCTYVPTYA